MAKFEIKHRRTGRVIFSGRGGSLKQVLHDAVTTGVVGVHNLALVNSVHNRGQLGLAGQHCPHFCHLWWLAAFQAAS